MSNDTVRLPKMRFVNLTIESGKLKAVLWPSGLISGGCLGQKPVFCGRNKGQEAKRDK